MQIQERDSGDQAVLQQRAQAAKQAQQRDRYRAVLLAIEGQPTQTIQQALGRSRGFVQRWCYAYRDHGIDADNVRYSSEAPVAGERQRVQAPRDEGSSDPHRPRVMSRRWQRRLGSVDRGTCGPGMEPRNFVQAFGAPR